jgi:hypothetical protein
MFHFGVVIKTGRILNPYSDELLISALLGLTHKINGFPFFNWGGFIIIHAFIGFSPLIFLGVTRQCLVVFGILFS